MSADERSRILGYFDGGPGDGTPRVNGLTFTEDMAMRQAALDPSGIRQMVLMPTQPKSVDDTRVILDADPYGEMKDAQGPMGGGDLVAAGPIRNLIRIASGGVRPRTVNGAEVLEPFSAMVNGVSVNVRAERAFQAAGDLLGMGA